MSRKTKIFKDQVRRELTIERTVAIPLKYAWVGWTKPEHIARWWGPKYWNSTVYEMDVRPGGVWRYRLCPDNGDGEDAYCRAVYQEVIEPLRLVYIDSFTDKNWNIVENSEMYTVVTFEEVMEGSKLRIITRFNSIAELNIAEEMGMVKGFTDAFNRLEEYLISISGGKL
ncbi:SRPBCC family protein [Heyndrickxia sporothermodurans]|uniref:SRPBCC family protein n=1 Tax=Heyndrickxia sporothermodurans TaxID=46224 RepID=UPI002E1C7915|nr:SRPBCC domain-containing protein [Heyndrickxia sporothermodurans]MED3699474.1 SRPBCC domain-containing protein [Heyndrickxia sporothermodurans]MED3782805.1 SRPBCC domain-containing protein [Heyndrickxia sporothermodurans]